MRQSKDGTLALSKLEHFMKDLILFGEINNEQLQNCLHCVHIHDGAVSYY